MMYKSQIAVAVTVLLALLFIIALGALTAVVLAAPAGERISNTLSGTITVSPPTEPPSPPSGGVTLPPVIAGEVDVLVTPDSGGNAKLDEATLTIPPGAVAVDTVFSMRPADPAPRPTQGTVRVLGKEYVITAADTNGNVIWQFDQPLTLTIPVPADARPEDLTMAYWDETLHTWIAVPTQIIDGQLVGSFSHLTVFAMLSWPDLPRFNDIQGHWSEGDIVALSSMGVVSGYGDGTYRPETSLTRGEAVKLLVCGLKLSVAQDVQLAFTDEIPEWALPYVQAAVRAGVVQGYEDGTFRGGAYVSRAEWVLMLVRAGRWQPQPGPEFSDSLPIWAADAIKTAHVLGLVKGYPDGTFRANSLLTRGEAAAVVYRAARLR